MNPRILPFYVALSVITACGGSSGRGNSPDSGPSQNTDAKVVYVHVAADSGAGSACACVCSDPCHCSCDCGTGKQTSATMPECQLLPANVDASVVNDAPGSYDTRSALVPDAATDGTVPSTDTRADLPQLPTDASYDSAAMPASDTNIPDTALDYAVDKPSVDTRPACTTPLCQCAAADAGTVLPISLAGIAGIADYTTLGLGKYLNTQIGFGVYSDDVGSDWIKPSIVLTSGAGEDSEVSVVYDFIAQKFSVGTCNCYYMYYDWFSLRRQFVSKQDFCGATGFQIDIKGDISKPRPEATLRITLADTACKNADGSPASPSDGGPGSDELWWKNIPQASFGTEWKTLQIPFSEFTLGNSRANDRKLDPRCITAFEVNYQYDVDVWCGDGCDSRDNTAGSGHFEFRKAQIY